MSRSQRYRTMFSIATVDVPRSALEALSSRQQKSILRDLARMLTSSIRSVDTAVHARDDIRHRFAVILPETGREGAGTLTRRLAERVGERLRGRSVPIEGDLGYNAMTFPGDETSLRSLRAEFEEIDHFEHPEAALRRDASSAEREDQEG
jgi:hypothetical protein